jgi:hypothetical protein
VIKFGEAEREYPVPNPFIVRAANGLKTLHPQENLLVVVVVAVVVVEVVVVVAVVDVVEAKNNIYFWYLLTF